MSLATYIRTYTPFYGTKVSCNQGGCGACIVMQSYYDADSNINRNVSINSCLQLVIDCDGTVITTVEGIKYTAPSFINGGNPYHPVQERLWKTSGLQCGFCTAGMAMTTYTSLQPNTLMQQLTDGSIAGIDTKTLLEKMYDGNLCRCSAFHGIIKTARSFNSYWQYTGGAGNTIAGYQLTTVGADGTGPTGSAYYVQTSNAALQQFNQPVTSVAGPSVASVFSTFQPYNPSLDVNGNSTGAYYGKNINYYNWLQSYTGVAQTFTTTKFGYSSTSATTGTVLSVYRVLTVNDAITQILTSGYNKIKLQNSWTSNKVPGYAFDPNQFVNYLDTSRISSLKSSSVSSTGATFGCNVPINKVVNLLRSSSDSKWQKMAEHLFYVSGQSLRNIAGIVGSLVMTKNGFGGDVATVLMAGKATLSGYYITSSTSTAFSGLSIQAYLATSEASQMILITGITIPASATGEFYWSYRVAQRPYNSHAFLNIGFNTTLSGATNAMSNTIVCYGALGNSVGVTISRASTVESYLNTQVLGSSASTAALNTIIAGALTRSQTDITVTPLPEFALSVVPNSNTTGRQQLVSSLLFASLLQVINIPFPLASTWPSTASALEDWVHKTTQGLSDNTYEYIFNPIGTPESSLTGDDAATYPVHQSFPALDGIYKSSGEARYTDDMPNQQTTYYIGCVGTTIAIGAVDWVSSTGVAARTAAKTYALSVPGVVDYFDWLDISPTVANGGMNFNNVGSQNMSAYEILANKAFNNYGARLAIIVATSDELAKRVAQNVQTYYPYRYLSAAEMNPSWINGTKTYFTNPALSIYDAFARNSATGGVFLAFGGTGANTGCNTYVGKNAQNRLRNNQFPVHWTPYWSQTGDFGYSSRSVTGSVGLPPNGFTGPYINTIPSWTGTDNLMYFTGADGNAHLWSPFVINNPTGVFTSEVYHAYMDKNAASCYRDDQGNYIVYSGVQSTDDLVNSFLGNTISGTTAPIIDRVFIKPNQLIYRGRRMGGSFGGKIGNSHYAWISIIACVRNNGVMVKYTPSLEEDNQHNGARPDLFFPWNVAFNASGAIQSVTMNYNTSVGGAANQNFQQSYIRSGIRNPGDGVENWITLLNNVPNFSFDIDCAMVPRPMYNSYRGAYNGESHVALYSMMDDVAAITNLKFTQVTSANIPSVPSQCISAGISPTIFSDMYTTFTTDSKYNYAARYNAIYNSTGGFNATNTYKKRALSIAYNMYAMNKLNGAPHDVTIRICPNGDVHVWTCIVESGQGTWAKMAQIISNQLGVPITNIFQMEYDRRINWGNNDTGGSQGTYDACIAAVDACNNMKAIITGALGACLAGGANAYTGAGNSDLLFTVPSGNWNNGFIANATTAPGSLWGALAPMTGAGYVYNLTSLSRQNNNVGWRTLVNCLNNIGEHMSGAFGNASAGTPANQGIGRGASYNVNKLWASGNEVNKQLASFFFMATMVEVEVDALTGNVFPIEVDIIGDCGNDVNPLFDAEQMIGGYVYGIGLILTEMRTYDSAGKQLINNTWNYKVPCMTQLPNTIKYQVANRNFEGNWQNFPTPIFGQPFGSRSIAEQGMCAAATTLAGIKEAIRGFRIQNNLNPVYNCMLPLTPDQVITLSGYGASSYKLA